jgi:general secretion pathway protein G
MHKQLNQEVQKPTFGFTLLELLVVMVIIGLLASYVGPRYFAQVGKSETNAARAQVEALAKALDTYRIDIGAYPSTAQGLGALVARPEGVNKWSGPYLQKDVPTDPWGRPYQYKSPGDAGRDFDITSLGKDGQAGGEGDAADIRSWERSQ